MQYFKFMGMNIPFDLSGFVNDNGRNPETLKILGVLCINILRTSKDLRKEIIDTVAADSEFKAQIIKEISAEKTKGGK